jgi:hypothetical protein
MDAYQASGSSPQESKSDQSLPAVDLRFENHFSLFLIRPCSETGQRWLDDNVGNEETLIFAGAVVCEGRYVESILRGAIEAGLAVQS